MTDMSSEPRHAAPAAPPKWTGGHKFLAGALIVAGLAITGLAFGEIYVNVTGLLRPSMGHWAGIVPISGEIAFAFLFALGILLALRRAPGGGLRGLFMAVLMAASIPLNIWDYRDSVPASLGHLLPVAAFFGCMLAGKGAVMSLRGGKVRADRISGGEWFAHPWRSLSLWRWMATWGETSREAALTRYMVLLFAVAIAQADDRVGRVPFVWRRRLPVTLRYQLDTGTFPPVVVAAIEAGDWQKRVEDWVTDALTSRDKTRGRVRQARATIDRDTTADVATAPEAPVATAAATVSQRPARDKAPDDWRDKAAAYVAGKGGPAAVRDSRLVGELAAHCGVVKRTAERYIAGLLAEQDAPAEPPTVVPFGRSAREG